MQTSDDPATPPPHAHGVPLRTIYGFAALLVVLLIAGGAAILVNLRDSTLHNRLANLDNISLVLTEQANRSLQGLDLVLNSLEDMLAANGVTSSAAYRDKMSSLAVHELLHEKLTGLPFVNAIAMVDADGNLINFSRYWPIPSVNVADRDYFKALMANPSLPGVISVPVQNRGDGSWTVYRARPVRTPDGRLAGLLLGAIELRYFEDLYHAIGLGPETAITLLRDDGVLMARYPPGPKIGGTARRNRAIPREPRDVPVIEIRASHFDGKMRLHVRRALADYPMVISVSETQTAALASWTNIAWTLGLIIAGCAVSILTATMAIARGWRHHEEIGRERAERAEAERARAMTEAELAHEREKNAEAASRAKSGFLAMMSHEIRTPMNAVLGLAGTLLDEALPPQQRRAIEAIRDSGDSLLRILNDILDFSKLDAGRMTLEDMAFSPATLTHNIISILGPRATAKGLAISATSDPTLPPVLMGDAGRIRQILLNLVSNAVKFTERGSVAIEALNGGQGKDGTVVEWVVSDTGIGIPPDHIRSLFGEFIQMDNSIHRRFGGSGLGLAICKRLTDQMGGTISVTSTLGQGSIFRLRLTLPVSDQPVELASDPTDAVARFEVLRKALGRPVRVLFAEDNPTNQFVAAQLLKGLDLQLDMVGDGLEAVDAAGSFLYDMIFMDVRMPEMDGLSATRAIRARGGRLARIPIIALTANAFPEDVQACLDAGMNQFLPKPVHKDMLISSMVAALSDNAPTPPNLPDRPVVHAHPDALDQVALDAMVEAIGEDGVAEMVAMFERETRERMARLAQPAASKADLVREVHTLKGAARTVCAQSLGEAAATAEQRAKDTGELDPADFSTLNLAFEAWLSAIHARLPETAVSA
jgi:signal transduction histidine kinase/DNA-binding response OmpR family regulator